MTFLAWDNQRQDANVLINLRSLIPEGPRVAPNVVHRLPDGAVHFLSGAADVALGLGDFPASFETRISDLALSFKTRTSDIPGHLGTFSCQFRPLAGHFGADAVSFGAVPPVGGRENGGERKYGD